MYCKQCDESFDPIEGNENREYCSDECEILDAYCNPMEHHWFQDGPWDVVCDECGAEGRIQVRIPTLGA